MKPEYQKIADKWLESDAKPYDSIKGAVSDCEALANKEWKMLTEEDCVELARTMTSASLEEFCQRVIYTFIKKQEQPETVTVRLLRCCDGAITPVEADAPIANYESWASDPVEIEVKP